VIMGSLDGNRLWGKETGIAITRVEWSPDCRLLLFVCESGEVRVHDHHGNFLLNIPGTGGDKAGAAVELVHWYDKLEGLVDVNAPVLAIAFSNGRVSLLRHETDSQAVLIDTGLTIQVYTHLMPCRSHLRSLKPSSALILEH
jgi:WD repeat-containing protein 35